MIDGVSPQGNLPHLHAVRKKATGSPASSKPGGSQADAADIDKTGKAPRVVTREELEKLFGDALADFEPPSGPVADACTSLAKSGFTLSESQVRHAIKSFDKHKEALVVFEGKTEQIYSFRDSNEIALFHQLKASPDQAPAETRSVHTDLQALEASGGQIAFSRGRDLLPTDAAGATVLLGRGESVVLLDRYGAPSTVSTAADASKAAQSRPAPDAAKEAVIEPVLVLEKKGYGIAPDFDLPEDLQVTDIAGMVKHQISQMLSKDPNHEPINERRYAIDQLAGSGVATVVPPAKHEDPIAELKKIAAKAKKQDEDDEPVDQMSLPEPRVLNRAQLTELSQIAGGAMTPQQQQYFDDMKKIREDAVNTPNVFSRESTGLQRGALHQANDLVGYLNLINEGGLVLLNSDGSIVHLDSPGEVKEYAATGQVTRNRPAPVDPQAPKTNLLMLYYDSPFDPTQKGGIYEDTPMRASQVGSNAEVDMVTLRSDMPHKKNLRNEYLQPDDMQLIASLDPKTLMNDPKTLENFVYDTLKAHPDDKHVRLMVAGHGGAELGLMPDGESNDASAHGAMSVDDFASAIHEGLARFNKETGKSRKIDNLIVGSCLMANTSFIHALAKKGDIEVLSASPETLMGNDPNIIFSYLADPKTSDKSGPEFASDLVELLEGAAAFPGGRKNLQFADTFGAYDLSPTKGQKMADSLQTLFKAVVAEPQFAQYVKEDITACPTYGINRFVNLQFGINQRDIIQVAERIANDARIGSDAIKQACKDVVAATEAVVLKQKMDERYADRRGPTLYLPTESFAIDERLMNTDLLKSSSFSEFIQLVGSQKANRSLVENLTYEVDKVMRGLKRAAKDDGKSGGAKVSKKSLRKLLMAASVSEADRAAKAVQGAEKIYRPLLSKLYRAAIGGPVVIAATAVGALAGAVVGAAVLTPLGSMLGLRAGLTGRSAAQNFLADDEKTIAAAAAGSAAPNAGTPAPTAPSASATAPASSGSPAAPTPTEPPSDREALVETILRPAIRLGTQVALFPMEAAGETVNRSVSYSHGTVAGRLSGATVGTASGVVGGALSGALLGGAAGGFIANRVSRFVMRMG